MKTIHNEVGYNTNVKIIEDALDRGFGVYDLSHVNTAVAAHIWSSICGRSAAASGEIEWGLLEVMNAVRSVKLRIENIEHSLEVRHGIKSA